MNWKGSFRELPRALLIFVGNDGSHPKKGRALCEVQRCGNLSRVAHQIGYLLTGTRLAKDRAADAVSKLMIPEVLDYPV